MKTIMNEAEHAAVSEAIRAAETKTSGEIYCVLSRQSDDYFFVSGFVMACALLLASAILAWVAHWYWFEIEARHLALAVPVALAAGLVLLKIVPRLTMAFVPRSVGYRRADAQAQRQFLAHNLHTTENRTGVMLFASMAERYATVIADEGINAKVAQSDWDNIVALIVDACAKGKPADGFVAAIDASGTLLARHFPPGDNNRNELPDHLAEI